MPAIRIFLAVLSLALLVVGDTCNHDNCYRGFNGAAVTAQAEAFCSIWTKGITLSATGLPTGCSRSPAPQVSSVCSCAYPASSTTSSPFAKITSSKSSSTTKFSSSSTEPTSTFHTSTTTTHPEFPPGCAADNCLRALDRFNASLFCSLFTLGPSLAPPLPTYATACRGSTSSRLSSACSCLDYNPTKRAISFPTFPPNPHVNSSTYHRKNKTWTGGSNSSTHHHKNETHNGCNSTLRLWPNTTLPNITLPNATLPIPICPNTKNSTNGTSPFYPATPSGFFSG